MNNDPAMGSAYIFWGEYIESYNKKWVSMVDFTIKQLKHPIEELTKKQQNLSTKTPKVWKVNILDKIDPFIKYQLF